MKVVAAALFMLFLALSAVAQPYEGPDTLWTRVHGFPALSSYLMGDAVPLSDGGVMVSGNYVSLDESEYGPCLTRLDNEGNLLWQRPSHDSMVITNYPTSLCQISPDLFLLAAPLLTGGQFDPCLTLCDGEGTIIWQRVFHLPNWQYVWSVRSSGDGAAVVIFDTENLNTGSRVAEVLKVSDVGDSVWRHDYPIQGGNSSGVSITPSADGGYAFIEGNAGGTLLVKLDGQGNVEFSRSYNFLDGSGAMAVTELSNGDYVLCGWALSQPMVYPKALVWRVSPTGDSLWSWVSDSLDTRAREVMETADCGFVCILNVDFLVRFSASGQFQWQRHCSLPPPYTIYMEPDLSQDGQGHYRIVCDAYRGVNAVPYLGMLMTQPDPVAVPPQRPVLAPDDLGLTVFPNPFNSTTHLEFTLPSAQRVSLRLYDLLGREVAVMMNAIQTAGRHQTMFDASGLPSGVYLCRLEAGGMAQTRKMVLIK